MNCTWGKSHLPNSFKIILTFSTHNNFLWYCEISLKFFHDGQIYFAWGCQKWLSAWKFSFDSQSVAWFVRETRGISASSWSVCLPLKTTELVDCLWHSCGIQAGTDSQFSHHELEMWEITSRDRCNCNLQGAGKKVVCTMCPVADRMADTAFLAELLLRFGAFSLIKGFLLKFFAWAWLGIMKTEKPLFNKAVLLYCY